MSDNNRHLSDAEAKEFHGLFMMSFIVFTIVAIIAHFLVWNWRPWLPGPTGYATPAAASSTMQTPAAS
ncbi:light-harvesting antenna LH1, beta subunit [Sandaracinobacteroides saxicola]|uniref:Light-harvesting protein n=1 Tax=Sandaracinobacteroides saxicola TaxID=2759707 RepID=A0A7G5IKT0_9SPHN|nr:light-harvesting antenna LH1, beta subunit [Sandaracinobacteroides saxicola]QMW23972.1 light-harvesting protein [Sandaracinobacteroides saxicola]